MMIASCPTEVNYHSNVHINPYVKYLHSFHDESVGCAWLVCWECRKKSELGRVYVYCF